MGMLLFVHILKRKVFLGANTLHDLTNLQSMCMFDHGCVFKSAKWHAFSEFQGSLLLYYVTNCDRS